MRPRTPERGWWITLMCFCFCDLSWIFLPSILMNPWWWVNHFQSHLAAHSLPQFPFDPFRYSKETNSPTPTLTMCLGDESWCQSRCDFDPGSPAVLFRFPPFGYFHCMEDIKIEDGHTGHATWNTWNLLKYKCILSPVETFKSFGCDNDGLTPMLPYAW